MSHNSRFTFGGALVIAPLLWMGLPTPAQDLTGVISGTVRDSSQAVVPGAEVTVSNAATGLVIWRGTTGTAGVYVAPALPAGRYNVVFSFTGFRNVEVSDFPLEVNQRARLDGMLSPGVLTETITVSGETLGRLEIENSSISEVLDTSQVRNLPLPSRNVLNLLTLVGGVSSGGSATGINSAQLSINGSRTLNSEFTVDGVSVVSGSTGGVGTLPSTDAIREFRVLTSGYSAEYGRTSGGFVSLVSESGTSHYHGGVYEYFRNETLNANSFFRNLRGEPRSPDRWNQFGAKLGGPIRIPRLYDGSKGTFFFFNYEGLRQRGPASPISTIPDAAFRQGDFSTSPVVVADPLTGQPFPGNRIPQGRMDTAAVRMMNLLPQPNSPGSLDATTNRRINNVVNTQSTTPANNEVTFRGDHNVGERVRLFGRLTDSRNRWARTVILPGALDPGQGDGSGSSNNATLGYTHTLRPALILEARLGFNRNKQRLDPPSEGMNVPEVLGIARSIGGAAPRFMITGWRELGLEVNTKRREITNTTQGAVTLNWVHDRHFAKFGFQLRKSQLNVFNPGMNFTGVYDFTGQLTSRTRTAGNPVNALADFLLGQIKTATYTLPQPMTGRRNSNLAFFAQDDWKLTGRLTLNLGLRYEYESPTTSSNDIYSRVSPVAGRLLAAGRNASRSLDLEADKLNLAPRIGFAYSLNQKTVVRSGFGVFFGQTFSNLGGQVLFPGFTVNQYFLDLGVGIAQPFTLREGMPLVAVQDLNDPFLPEREASPSSPMAPFAAGAIGQYGGLTPLPSSLQWNFSVQRQLPGGGLVDVTYVGTRGLHLPIALPYNLVPFERGEEIARLATALATQQARPFPNLTGFSAYQHAATSSYHSLQLKAVREFSKTISFLTTYTWSKSLDDGSGIFAYSQPSGLDAGQFPSFSRRLDRAVSAFDRPHTLAAALQFVVNAGPRFLRGTQFNPILVARDGLPDTITQTNLHPSVTQQRPSAVGTNAGAYADRMTSEGTAIRFLLAPNGPGFPFVPTGPLFSGTGAARTLVLPASLGTLGRNTTRAPGELNLDLAISRRFPLTEKLALQLRAEAFNALNHTNFGGPNTNLPVIVSAGKAVFNAPSFGLITSARAARFMQIVARLEF